MLVLLAGLGGISFAKAPCAVAAAKNGKAEAAVYDNTQYRFQFWLPPEWASCTAEEKTWDGDMLNKGAKAESGPLIILRHPLWRDDFNENIPIMVFTKAQWKLIEDDAMTVSAAPFSPDRIGENKTYVFALPPRWSNATDIPQDEIQKILESNPLHAY